MFPIASIPLIWLSRRVRSEQYYFCILFWMPGKFRRFHGRSPGSQGPAGSLGAFAALLTGTVDAESWPSWPLISFCLWTRFFLAKSLPTSPTIVKPCCTNSFHEYPRQNCIILGPGTAEQPVPKVMQKGNPGDVCVCVHVICRLFVCTRHAFVCVCACASGGGSLNSQVGDANRLHIQIDQKVWSDSQRMSSAHRLPADSSTRNLVLQAKVVKSASLPTLQLQTETNVILALCREF